MYFLLLSMLFCSTVYGNGLWQNLINIRSKCAHYYQCFARKTKDNSFFTASMLVPISGMSACLVKAYFCELERRSLEQQNPWLYETIRAVEKLRIEREMLLGPNWSVSINYGKLYKDMLGNESDLYKKLMCQFDSFDRFALGAVFFMCVMTCLMFVRGEQDMVAVEGKKEDYALRPTC